MLQRYGIFYFKIKFVINALDYESIATALQNFFELNFLLFFLLDQTVKILEV